MSSRTPLAALFLLLLVPLLSAPAAAQVEQPRAVEAAKRAAESWLTLADAGKYRESWEGAGAQFRSAVTADQWARQAGQVSEQLGSIQRREIEDATYTTQLPGAPAGEYVVLTYDSSYQALPDAAEIVALVKEGEGWKVVGWFVRPAG